MYKKIATIGIIFLFIEAVVVPGISTNTIAGTTEKLNSFPKASLTNNGGDSDYRDQYTKGLHYNGFKIYKGSGSGRFLAQSFQPSLPTLTKVKLKLAKWGSLSDDLIISIRNSQSSNDLASVSKTPDEIPSGDAGWLLWTTIIFPNINVNVGEKYYIVCRTNGGDMWNNFYGWRFSSDFRYWKGEMWYGAGDSWVELIIGEADDFEFETYGWDPNNQPPNAPTIIGSSVAMLGAPFPVVYTSNDPDGDNVQYWIDWGDGTVDKWSDYYKSNEEVSSFHTYYKLGIYRISVIAKDSNYAESNWAEFDVTVVKNRIATNIRFLDLFKCFLNNFFYLGRLYGK